MISLVNDRMFKCGKMIKHAWHDIDVPSVVMLIIVAVASSVFAFGYGNFVVMGLCFDIIGFAGFIAFGAPDGWLRIHGVLVAFGTTDNPVGLNISNEQLEFVKRMSSLMILVGFVLQIIGNVTGA